MGTERPARHPRQGLLQFKLRHYPEFPEAFRDFKDRWPHAYDSLPKRSISDLLDEIGETPEIKEAPKDDRPEKDETQWHYFDPDRDSIGSLIVDLEYFCDDRAGDFAETDLERLYGQWAEGLTWLRETVGLDFDEIQTRWRDFPVIIVPHHVSDKYNPDPSQPYGLFGYLNQVRRAYMIGADLAAVALCRSTTELLIRYHYASDVSNASNSRKTKLSWLIKQVENREELSFLKNFNLTAKVDDANDILHTSADDIDHRDRARGLVIVWVRDLQEMITKAPTRGSAAQAP
jgi:hypothetical protein